MVTAAESEKSCSTWSQRKRCYDVSPHKSPKAEGACVYEMVGYDSLPQFLKHNEFILGYYRSEWPLKQTLLSIFSIHNETINIWTHLIGFFLFLALTIFTAFMVPSDESIISLQNSPSLSTRDGLNVLQSGVIFRISSSVSNASDFRRILLRDEQTSCSSSADHLLLLLTGHGSRAPINGSSDVSFQSNSTEKKGVKDERANVIAERPVQRITRWPFVAFLFGAMFCLLTSSACHLLACHSELVSYVMLRLDYAGISVLIVTSFYPLVYYAFLCDPFFSNLYIISITIFGVATVVVSLFPVFETPEFRVVRAGIFFFMGVSGLVPIMHKLMLFNHRPEALVTTVYEMIMGAFYGLGVVIYATRIPERWTPGKFDLVGHSHQLFHVLVVAGAYMHYLSGLVYLHWRDLDGC